jgi:hypothetical protein
MGTAVVIVIAIGVGYWAFSRGKHAGNQSGFRAGWQRGRHSGRQSKH